MCSVCLKSRYNLCLSKHPLAGKFTDQPLLDGESRHLVLKLLPVSSSWCLLLLILEDRVKNQFLSPWPWGLCFYRRLLFLPWAMSFWKETEVGFFCFLVWFFFLIYVGKIPTCISFSSSIFVLPVVYWPLSILCCLSFFLTLGEAWDLMRWLLQGNRVAEFN